MNNPHEDIQKSNSTKMAVVLVLPSKSAHLICSVICTRALMEPVRYFSRKCVPNWRYRLHENACTLTYLCLLVEPNSFACNIEAIEISSKFFKNCPYIQAVLPKRSCYHLLQK